MTDFYDDLRKAYASAVGYGMVVLDIPGHGVAQLPEPSAVTLSEFDEVIAGWRQHDAELRDAATDEQNTITWGDHFRADYPAHEGRPALTVYGEIPTLDWWRTHEPDRYVGWDRPGTTYAAGFRFGWCSSVLVNREPGYTHVAFMTKITPDEFDDARARGWRQP